MNFRPRWNFIPKQLARVLVRPLQPLCLSSIVKLQNNRNPTFSATFVQWSSFFPFKTKFTGPAMLWPCFCHAMVPGGAQHTATWQLNWCPQDTRLWIPRRRFPAKRPPKPPKNKPLKVLGSRPFLWGGAPPNSRFGRLGAFQKHFLEEKRVFQAPELFKWHFESRPSLPKAKFWSPHFLYARLFTFNAE